MQKIIRILSKDHVPRRYIQSWPKILVPLVNNIKEGCENVSALLILLIFYLKNHENLTLEL